MFRSITDIEGNLGIRHPVQILHTGCHLLLVCTGGNHDKHGITIFKRSPVAAVRQIKALYGYKGLMSHRVIQYFKACMGMIRIIQQEAHAAVGNGRHENILCRIGREIFVYQAIIVPLVQLLQAFLRTGSHCHKGFTVSIGGTVIRQIHIGTQEIQIHLLCIIPSAHCPGNGGAAAQILFLYGIEVFAQFFFCSGHFHSKLIQPVFSDVCHVAGFFRTSLLHHRILLITHHTDILGFAAVGLDIGAILIISVRQFIKRAAACIAVEQGLIIGKYNIRCRSAGHHDIQLVIGLRTGNGYIFHIDIIQFFHLFLNPLCQRIILRSGSGSRISSVPCHHADGYLFPFFPSFCSGCSRRFRARVSRLSRSSACGAGACVFSAAPCCRQGHCCGKGNCQCLPENTFSLHSYSSMLNLLMLPLLKISRFLPDIV